MFVSSFTRLVLFPTRLEQYTNHVQGFITARVKSVSALYIFPKTKTSERLSQNDKTERANTLGDLSQIVVHPNPFRFGFFSFFFVAKQIRRRKRFFVIELANFPGGKQVCVFFFFSKKTKLIALRAKSSVCRCVYIVHTDPYRVGVHNVHDNIIVYLEREKSTDLACSCVRRPR